MSDWYCYVGGQKYGPIEEATFRRWIQEGRVGPYDNVWTEGMQDWAAAATVPAISDAWSGLLHSMVPVPAPGGTGGSNSAWQLICHAWESLRGRWGLPIGFALLLWLITVAVQNVPYAGGLASLILMGAFELGAVIFYLTFDRGGPAGLGMLFAGFKNFLNALGAYLLVAIFVTLWMLLFSVVGIVMLIIALVSQNFEPILIALAILGFLPGLIAAIIAQLAYSQTFYVLATNLTQGPLAAIRASKKMMSGHKARLFCLQLWFVLFSIACIFTLFIGLLWVVPLGGVAKARFYDDLQSPPAACPQTATDPAASPADLGPNIYQPQ